jgi:iron(III) transport system substrate-binding protein
MGESITRRADSSRAPARRAQRAVALVGALGLAVGTLAACGGGSKEPPKVQVKVGQAPSYYPSSYADVIKKSKAEGGTLNIYSNTDQSNWDPIFRAFTEKYPWVKKISANNLDSDEVFQKYLSEQATGKSPADMLVTNAAQAWGEFTQKNADKLLKYDSPEKRKLPGFAEPLPNVYAFSMDPVTLSYNSQLLGGKPQSLSDLAALIKKDPNKFKNKITERAVDGSFGFTVSNAYANGVPNAWDTLKQVLPSTRPEDSSGTQIDKIESGEYLAGFFISASVAYPAEEDSGGLFKVTYLKDGTPVLPRGIGITATASHPATAKLFLDFLLSQEGQQAVAEGGLTSYRSGVKAGFGVHTYQELVKDVGEQKIIQVKYDALPTSKVNAFVKKWNGLVGQ